MCIDITTHYTVVDPGHVSSYRAPLFSLALNKVSNSLVICDMLVERSIISVWDDVTLVLSAVVHLFSHSLDLLWQPLLRSHSLPSCRVPQMTKYPFQSGIQWSLNLGKQ